MAVNRHWFCNSQNWALFLWEELQLWRNVILWASVLDNPEPLSFGKIQEVVQVDIGVEQNVHGGHEI